MTDNDQRPDTVSPDGARDSSHHFQFLIECFRTAREEELGRIKRRDTLLELQLLSQAVLLAVAQGISIPGGGVITQPHPTVLAIAMATSLVLASLYVVEDRLIGYLSRYIGAVSSAEKELTNSDSLVVNWDISQELREYARHVIPVRFLGQIIAFLVIPGGLIAYHIAQLPNSWDLPTLVQILADAALFAIIAALLMWSLLHRRLTGSVSPNPVLLRVQSPYEYGRLDAATRNKFSFSLILIICCILLVLGSMLVALGYVIASRYPL
jgi:hypothetical protein